MNPQNVRYVFAERLKALRKRAGYTQIDLANILHVSKGTVAMWETAKRMPDIECGIVLARLFHCRLDYLLGVSIIDDYYDYDLEFLM